MSSDWTVGHPSDNKAFVATVVIASLLITSFFIGTGYMIYIWIKSWQGEDVFGRHISEGENEKGNIDLEAGRTIPSRDESDESPIVEGPTWRHETVTIGASPSESESSSTRTSSSDDLTPTRPRSQDFHELYPRP